MAMLMHPRGGLQNSLFWGYLKVTLSRTGKG